MYDIHNTAVCPYIIAEKITPDRPLQDYLIAKSERLYANNKGFRNGLDNASDERVYLYKFMQHWILGYSDK